jgi:hypothetical protein
MLGHRCSQQHDVLLFIVECRGSSGDLKVKICGCFLRVCSLYRDSNPLLFLCVRVWKLGLTFKESYFCGQYYSCVAEARKEPSFSCGKREHTLKN